MTGAPRGVMDPYVDAAAREPGDPDAARADVADRGLDAPVAARADRVRACLRARYDPRALALLREAAEAGRVDWGALVGDLVAGRLEGLAYPVLGRRPWVPPHVRDGLRRASAAYGARNTLLLAALADAARRLAAAGIPALALKGAALVESVYASAGERPMNDIDILVPADRAAAAADVLLAAGYRWARATDVAAALAFENELMLRRAGPVEIVIDLHWHLLDAPYYQRRVPMDWFWQTSRPLVAGGGALRMLGPEALILHLCAHLALHHGRRPDLGLRLLADIAEVAHRAAGGGGAAEGPGAPCVPGAVETPGPSDAGGAAPGRGIDWGLVVDRARAWDLVTAVRRVLPEAARLGAPIPGAVLDEMGRLRPSAAERRVVAALTAEAPSAAERFWSDLSGMSGMARRLRFVGRSLFPSPDYMRWRYGCDGPALALAYVWRWCLGLRGALGAMVRR